MSAEQTRILKYDNVEYELIEDLTVKQKDKRKIMVLINVSTFIILIAIIAAGIAAIYLIHGDSSLEFNFIAIMLYMFSFIAYIFAHEFVHGLAFRFAGKIPWRNISYGFVPKSAVAYCISDVPVSLHASRISLTAPLVILCLPVLVLSIVFGNIALLFAAGFYASGSSGDLWYLWILRRKPKVLFMIEEKPTNGEYKLGCYLVKPV